MRFDIRYRTVFSYEQPVVESQNVLRACPASDQHQQVLHYDVRTTPSSRVFSYFDHWGTRVDAFGVRLPHDHLEVEATASVETLPRQPMTASPSREDLLDDWFRDQHLEFLEKSPHANGGPQVAAEAREATKDVGDDVVGMILALHRHIATGFEYRPGATYVGVDVEEVFAARAGVCQDFAHAVIAMARALSIPARYVSGYLFATDDAEGADPDVDEVEVSTHAWVEFAVPYGGWWALDPTNRQEGSVRHIKIGHGRDYDDVAPLRGVYLGPAEHDLDVSVTIRRTAQQQQQQ
ncbi:MAG: transglutaminase family protein [Nitriliruptorales bacterium]|nr:transglutaminase family protein [Nitriliruptorales bacterium]